MAALEWLALLMVVSGAVVAAVRYGFQWWPGQEVAVDAYGRKRRLLSKGPGGISVVDPLNSPDIYSWQEVKDRFPSHAEEAEARIEEAKARKEAESL